MFSEVAHNAVRKVVPEKLEMWVVSRGWPGCPDGFVARKYVAKTGEAVPTQLAYRYHGLAECQEFLTNKGLIRFERSETDDQPVVETWL